jgi:hypothetical protein
MTTVRIFMSFDRDNDRDLHDRLVEDAQRGGSGFEIAARSGGGSMSDRWSAGTRRRISEADEVIVICGEHTEASSRIAEELRMAQEEDKPYLLLWGRRDSMCQKPRGARAGDGMYRWTPDTLGARISTTLRDAQPLRVPDSCKRGGSAAR